jgi:hypothetical protein
MVAIRSTYENDGVLGLNAGELATVGWEMFDGDFPPLIDHSIILRGSAGRHFVRVTVFDQEGATPGFGRAVYYTVQNLDSEFIFTGLNYIWFNVQP